jgi:hypothetical protein
VKEIYVRHAIALMLMVIGAKLLLRV